MVRTVAAAAADGRSRIRLWNAQAARTTDGGRSARVLWSLRLRRCQAAVKDKGDSAPPKAQALINTKPRWCDDNLITMLFFVAFQPGEGRSASEGSARLPAKYLVLRPSLTPNPRSRLAFH